MTSRYQNNFTNKYLLSRDVEISSVIYHLSFWQTRILIICFLLLHTHIKYMPLKCNLNLIKQLIKLYKVYVFHKDSF